MFTFPQIVRRTALAGLTLGVLTTTGCQQLSKYTRTEKVMDGQSSPMPPDFGSPSPQLEAVPQSLPPMAVPPPAPPSDAASLNEEVPEFTAEWNWEQEEVEVVADEAEAFPTAAPDVSREFSTERAEASAQRLAVEGRLAARRRSEQPPQLPVIVPGYPSAPKVAAEAPLLLPVPK